MFWIFASYCIRVTYIHQYKIVPGLSDYMMLYCSTELYSLLERKCIALKGKMDLPSSETC